MSIDQIDEELTRLQAAITSVERSPKSFDEVWPEIESQIVQAEEEYRRWGPMLFGFQSRSPEDLHRQRVAAYGAAVVANKKAITDSEKARVRALTQNGIAASDKARRRDELSAAILRLAAQKELALRLIETDGDYRPRSVHAELLVFPQAEVARLAT